MKTTINVTQSDIDAGAPCSSRSCPIAIALNRVILPPDLESPDVRPDYVTFYRVGSRHFNRDLPPTAVDFINDFDLGRSVFPFSFELELPKSVLPKSVLAKAAKK